MSLKTPLELYHLVIFILFPNLFFKASKIRLFQKAVHSINLIMEIQA